MKSLFFSVLLAAFAISLSAQIPSLHKVGTSTCLMVDGKPFVMYCGELHNSTASSISYMQEHRVWDKLKEMHLNSVIATVSWELVEPVEGRYDFTLVDAMMAEARKRDMKIVFLWFGAFKNPMMTYAPSWVKKNPKKYPHAVDDKGQEMEHISVYGSEILKADTKAYKAFLQYLKDTDKDHTVVMIQLQNEPGLRGTPRDYSADANKAWKAQVPQQIVDYLKAKGTDITGLDTSNEHFHELIDVIKIHVDQRQVQTLLLHHSAGLDRTVFEQLHRQAGLLLKAVGQSREKDCADHGRDSDADRGLLFSQGRKLCHHGAGLLQNSFRPSVKGFPFLGNGDPVFFMMKKPEFQFLLQLPDGDRNRRLRHIQLFCRPRDTVVTADRTEILQLNQFHDYSSLVLRITLQGLPTATLWSGMSFVTTLPPPITTSLPMVTPGMTCTPAPIHTLSPTLMG